jgi:hypothetical protein
MSASFIGIALLAAVLIVNWRLVLLVLSACLLALFLMGLGVADSEAAPADPGQALVEEAAPTTK